MPIQLRNAKRPKRSEPRPIVELLQCVSIGDLCRLKVFPQHRHGRSTLTATFQYPFLKGLVVSRQSIDFQHVSGYTQRVGLHWCKAGFGQYPIFVCGECSCGARKLYLHHGRLACKHCIGAVHACQLCSGRDMRRRLRNIRLRRLLEFKRHGTKKTTLRRLAARLDDPTTKPKLNSKRLSHSKITLPSHNYQTRGAMHWR